VKIIVRSVLAATAVLAFASVARDQEPQYAPTVQTCRADVSLWYSDNIHLEYKNAQLAWLSDKVPNLTHTARLPLTEVDARTIEILECVQVDVDYNQHDRYYEAATFYQGISADRYYGFVVRHNLLQQLRREDKQGLR
jgi:hypothetical protein